MTQESRIPHGGNLRDSQNQDNGGGSLSAPHDNAPQTACQTVIRRHMALHNRAAQDFSHGKIYRALSACAFNALWDALQDLREAEALR